MKKIVIFGSTGSIGSSLINIIKKDKKNFKIELISANKNYKKLIKQANFFNIENLIISDRNSYFKAKKSLKNDKIKIYNNFNSFKKIFKDKKIDYTMSAITGFHGLRPTLNIIKFTKVLAIANKESIICGWNLIKNNLKKYKTEFIPVDSEHFSLHSLIYGAKNFNIKEAIITASGGPFNKLNLNKFKSISPTAALKHPNWSMGKKISVDSATMMNKVFEIIEAKKIFELKYSQLKILVHSQSYIHAIIQFTNGLTKILIHDTSMTIPIFNSLYPNFEKNIKSKKLDIGILNKLDIHPVNIKRFPVVDLIKVLPSNDSLFETVLVSANDTLVDLFLCNKINYTDISKQLLRISKLNEFIKFKQKKPNNLDEIIKLANYVSVKIRSLSI